MPDGERTDSNIPKNRQNVAALRRRIARCRLCVDHPAGDPLPHEPRPVLRISASARVCIAGQAPGTRVHASGVPFTDPSGDRLRMWMGIDDATFYDTSRIAIVPMGFCFPGLDAKGGDLPPRRECPRAWREAVFAALPRIELILAVGAYAQRWHLGNKAASTLTETVASWEAIAATTHPTVIPLPHPSWRNNSWLKKHPWFETDLLPHLRSKLKDLGVSR